MGTAAFSWLKEGPGQMGLTRSISALAVICAMGALTVGCASEAQLSGQVDFPSPDLPPPDQDGDGIIDPDDKCPTVKEDGKPPSPSDGCPNLDEDNDGILVPQDKCPTEPETVNQFEDEDGCPDKKPLVQIVGQEVKINQKILFKHDSAKIEAESTELLDAVGKIIKEHPELQLIEVGGHASKEGDDHYNRRLTQKRVESVVAALVERGVEKDRLMAQGYGFHCLLGAGTTETDHEQNRRVEFKILFRDNKPTDMTRGCEGSEKAGIKLKPLPATVTGAAAGKAGADAAKGAAPKPATGTGTGTGTTGSTAPAGKKPSVSAPKPPPAPAP
jgi:outer membrane protein OmpA-like peptidoglycan-associated protein